MAGQSKLRELRAALGPLGPLLPPVAAMSCVINILALTGSFYMLQVYDRVLSSRSVPTLVALSVLAVALYIFQGALEIVRGQVFVRLASRVDRALADKAHNAAMRLPLLGGSRAESLQPLRDVDTIRGYLASPGPIALFDIPWMPVYLAFVFMLHPMLGVVTLAGVAVMIVLMVATESFVRAPSRTATGAMGERVRPRSGLRAQRRGGAGHGLWRQPAPPFHGRQRPASGRA
jgi:ABC-type protease/lipase transport system fused ATPase/permease subunit